MAARPATGVRMLGRRRYVRKRSAKTQAADERAARAEARKYLRGEKVRRYESPKMIAQHGREPWSPKKAAADSLRQSRRSARVNDRYPTVELERRRGWTLAKAGVGRDRKTGRFVRRRAR